MKKILLFSSLLIGVLLLAGCGGSDGAESMANDTVASSLVAEVDFIDDGVIAMDQGEHAITFTLENTGEEPIVITTLYTSCMCTEARVNADGEWSDYRGMSGHGGSDFTIYQIVEAGASADVEVVFDPNAHGPNGTGTNRRAVYIETNSETTPVIEIGFTVDVVSTSDELPQSDESSEEDDLTYTDISPEELNGMLASEDFFLLDVHIPEQDHIDQTDAFIPYDEIANYVDELPEDKSTPIVVYCRSDSMSKEASQALLDLGYTDVMNLEGGRDAYVEFIE